MNDKQMLSDCFDVLTEHVNGIIDNHNVMPHEISVPFESGGRWMRLRLTISPIQSTDPEERLHGGEYAHKPYFTGLTLQIIPKESN